MRWFWQRRPQPHFALGIPGLAVNARAMLSGRLYAVATPSTPGDVETAPTMADAPGQHQSIACPTPLEPPAFGNVLAQISAGCLASTVAEALKDGRKAVAVLRSAADRFLALLSAHGVDVTQTLVKRQLTVLLQTDDYAAKLVKHGARHFVDELDFLGVERNSLIAIEHAEMLFSATDERSAIAQVRVYQHWFEASGTTGLMMFDAPAAGTPAALVLRTMGDSFSGLALLRMEGARFVWQVDHWLSPLGGVSQREYGIAFDHTGSLIVANGTQLDASNSLLQAAPDQDRVIVTRAVINGERGAPTHWRVVNDLAELLEAAEGAVAATCLIDFHGGDQLRVLARAVHYLRRKCGRGLRIIIRERSLRLRYSDELLLLRLGANTVVYAEVGFSRFISLTESLHGQVFGGSIPDDFESAVQAALPPPHSGYLTPAAFCDMVRDCIAQSSHIGIESTLICLYLLPEIAHLDALMACRMKRPGDLFTADAQCVWIFLYACREPDADATLDRVYREPLAQMFEGHVKFFSSTDILGAIDGLESRLYSAPFADYSSQLAAFSEPPRPAPLAAAPSPPAAVHPVSSELPPIVPLTRQSPVVASPRTAKREPLRLSSSGATP